MTRQTLCFIVMVFLVVLLFPIATFSFVRNGNFAAGACINERVNISMKRSDFISPIPLIRAMNQGKNVGTPFKFNISEELICDMIQKLFNVNGISNIISNELPGIPFMWEWLSVYFSSNLGDELVVDFKTEGIYIYNDSGWTNIYKGGIDPVNIVSFNSKLAVDFGPDNGIYVYNAGSWTRIHNGIEVKNMVGFIDRLVVDFGISFGIYEYNYQTDQWTKIYGKDKAPRDSMISFSDKLVVDFKTHGIYIYDDGVWFNIYKGGIDPVHMVSFDGKLAVDFGPDYGIYVYELETNTWKRIYKGVTVEKMAGFDKYLAVDFGAAYGLYVYEYENNTWSQIYKGGIAIEKMAVFNKKLAIDFGINYGIYEYNFTTDIWNKIYHASIPRDDMCASYVFD